MDSKILLHGVCLCGGNSENLIELSLWNNKGTLHCVTGTFSVNPYEENLFPFYAYQMLFPKNVVELLQCIVVMADIHIEMLVTAVAPNTADQYTCHITGSLISINVFLLVRHKKYQQSKYGP